MSYKGIYIDQPYDELIDKYILWKGNYSAIRQFIDFITVKKDVNFSGDLNNDQMIKAFTDYLTMLGETNIVANIKEFIVLWNRDRGIRS
jgi:hypothetical protein